MVNAAPISLTTACYAEVVPLTMLSEALALTCLLECAGVFGMPILAGKIADQTGNMGVPLYVAGSLICLGGVANIAANFVNAPHAAPETKQVKPDKYVKTIT